MASWNSPQWALCLALLFFFFEVEAKGEERSLLTPRRDAEDEDESEEPTDEEVEDDQDAQPEGKRKEPLKWDKASVASLRERLGDAVQKTARHLAKRMSQNGTFSGYEINYAHAKEAGDGMWVNHCEDVDVTRDMYEICVMSQLHALNSLCSVQAVKHSSTVKKVIVSHLKELGSGIVKDLSIRQSYRKVNVAQVWTFDNVTARNKSIPEFLPSLQAGVIAVLMHCAKVVKKTEYAENMMELWAGLARRYSFENWAKTQMIVAQQHQVYRYLTQASIYADPGSNLHSDFKVYLQEYEDFVYDVQDYLKKKQGAETASVDLAQGMLLRMHSKVADKALQKKIKKRAEAMLSTGMVFGPAVSNDGRPAFFECRSIAGNMALLNITRNPGLIRIVYEWIDLALRSFQLVASGEGGKKAPETAYPGWPYLEGGFFFPISTYNTVQAQADCLEGLMTAQRMLDKLPSGMEGIETIKLPTIKETPREPSTEEAFKASMYGGLDFDHGLMAEL
jgi:hypothetical protein